MNVNQAACELLDQISEVIKQTNNQTFKQSIPTLSGASIGQHIRHTLEFFICLIDAKNEGKLNYDHRKHDKFIEQEPELAQSVIGSIKSFLNKQIQNFDLEVRANYSISEGKEVVLRSNFHRELAYNIEHCIHHMALIKIGVREILPDLTLPAHFGVASSTVRYQTK